jgi:hypothetical protein
LHQKPCLYHSKLPIEFPTVKKSLFGGSLVLPAATDIVEIMFGALCVKEHRKIKISRFTLQVVRQLM